MHRRQTSIPTIAAERAVARACAKCRGRCTVDVFSLCAARSSTTRGPGTWLTCSSCEPQASSVANFMNLYLKLHRPDWWSNCSTDGVAGAASLVICRIPCKLFRGPCTAAKTHAPTGVAAGITCFQRNCLFTAAGFVMLYATHSLQVSSGCVPKHYNIFAFIRSPAPVQANVGVSLTPMAALPVPTHRAAAVNNARKNPTVVKIAVTVAIAGSRFAKNVKHKNAAASARDMALPLLHHTKAPQ
jgi:hypothetical protein